MFLQKGFCSPCFADCQKSFCRKDTAYLALQSVTNVSGERILLTPPHMARVQSPEIDNIKKMVSLSYICLFWLDFDKSTWITFLAEGKNLGEFDLTPDQQS